MTARKDESALSPHSSGQHEAAFGVPQNFVKLTDRTVAALACPAGRKDALFFDAQMSGFGVRVTAGGSRTFLLQYRNGPKIRRLVLGPWGEAGAKSGGLTTTQARALAERHRGAVREGRDPWAERKATQVAALAAEAEATRQKAAAAVTVEILLDRWLAAHASSRRPSYTRDVGGRVRHNLAPLLRMPAAGVTKADAVREIDRVAAGGGEVTARRTLAYARAIYGWAAKRGMLAENPFHGVPAPGREVSRDRVLTDAELGAVWRAAGREGPPYGPLTRVLLLTLARLNEVAGMTWGELAPDLSTWTQPGERTKNGKAHIVHLSGPAREELRSLLPPGGKAGPNDLVFTRAVGGGLTGFSALKRRLDAASGATGWRLHDFRRTGVTALARIGFPPHVADKLLNQITGTIGGVAAVYQRHDFATERARALDAWAAYVFRCAEGWRRAGGPGEQAAAATGYSG